MPWVFFGFQRNVELAGLDYMDNQASAADGQEIINAELAEGNAGSS